MPTATLSEFIDLLDRSGELARVQTRVSPVLEIAEVCDRVCKTPAPHGHKELDRNPAAAALNVWIPGSTGTGSPSSVAGTWIPSR